jgi:hypothetical protein
MYQSDSLFKSIKNPKHRYFKLGRSMLKSCWVFSELTRCSYHEPLVPWWNWTEADGRHIRRSGLNRWIVPECRNKNLDSGSRIRLSQVELNPNKRWWSLGKCGMSFKRSTAKQDVGNAKDSFIIWMWCLDKKPSIGSLDLSRLRPSCDSGTTE